MSKDTQVPEIRINGTANGAIRIEWSGRVSPGDLDLLVDGLRALAGDERATRRDVVLDLPLLPAQPDRWLGLTKIGLHRLGGSPGRCHLSVGDQRVTCLLDEFDAPDIGALGVLPIAVVRLLALDASADNDLLGQMFTRGTQQIGHALLAATFDVVLSWNRIALFLHNRGRETLPEFVTTIPNSLEAGMAVARRHPQVSHLEVAHSLMSIAIDAAIPTHLDDSALARVAGFLGGPELNSAPDADTSESLRTMGVDSRSQREAFQQAVRARLDALETTQARVNEIQTVLDRLLEGGKANNSALIDHMRKRAVFLAVLEEDIDARADLILALSDTTVGADMGVGSLLPRLGDRGLNALRAMWQSRSPPRRLAAFHHLPASLELLADGTRDGESEIRSTAAARLVDFGAAAIPHLQNLVDDPAVEVRRSVAKSAARIGPAHVTVIRALSMDSCETVRRALVDGLKAGVQTAELGHVLLTLVVDPNKSVREGALRKLQWYGPDYDIATIDQVLSHPNPNLFDALSQFWATVARVQSLGPETIPLLERLAEHTGRNIGLNAGHEPHARPESKGQRFGSALDALRAIDEDDSGP